MTYYLILLLSARDVVVRAVEILLGSVRVLESSMLTAWGPDRETITLAIETFS